MLSNLFKMCFGHDAWCFIPLTPAPGRLREREENVHEFKASLIYMMSSGLARAAE